MTHSTEGPRIWTAQRAQPWVVRSDDDRAAVQQHLVAEEFAECSYPLVIEAAARLVQDQNVWGCGKGHNN